MLQCEVFAILTSSGGGAGLRPFGALTDAHGDPNPNPNPNPNPKQAIWSIDGCTRGPEDLCSLCFKTEHGADTFELARLKNEMHLCGPFGPGAEGCTLQTCFGEGVIHHMQPDECRGETWKPAECVL